MALKKYVSEDGKKITISIDERFDFSVHQSFRDAYIDADSTESEFVLDLSNTTYMDSSALGMILLLKDHAEKSSSTLKISQPNDTVNKVLEIAQFHRLMTIER